MGIYLEPSVGLHGCAVPQIGVKAATPQREMEPCVWRGICSVRGEPVHLTTVLRPWFQCLGAKSLRKKPAVPGIKAKFCTSPGMLWTPSVPFLWVSRPVVSLGRKDQEPAYSPFSYLWHDSYPYPPIPRAVSINGNQMKPPAGGPKEQMRRRKTRP